MPGWKERKRLHTERQARTQAVREVRQSTATLNQGSLLTVEGGRPVLKSARPDQAKVNPTAARRQERARFRSAVSSATRSKMRGR